jgi:hypothetical protein
VIDRPRQRRRLLGLLRTSPVVALLGARQIGKTTLARQVAGAWKGPSTWFDLEDPRSATQLDAPMLVLERLRGLVVIDEVQRRPDLFPILRALADRPRRSARFLILGSAAPALVRGTSETPAGRVAHHVLGGLTLEEVGPKHWERLWWRGGFPASFAARSDEHAARWRLDFVRTFLERDMAMLGIDVPAAALRRMWSMIAHYHGGLWNGAELARSLALSESTVRRYLDLLAGTFVVRVLRPWHENLGKRQVKSPKVYVADSGLLHTLLDVGDASVLPGHPKSGASWEGFVVDQVAAQLGAEPESLHFWRTQAGAELDLLVTRRGRRVGFEAKWTDAPRLTPSLRTALTDLRLERLDVVHPGRDTYPMADHVRAVALGRLPLDVR